jgi:hypothetical protein
LAGREGRGAPPAGPPPVVLPPPGTGALFVAPMGNSFWLGNQKKFIIFPNIAIYSPIIKNKIGTIALI